MKNGVLVTLLLAFFSVVCHGERPLWVEGEMPPSGNGTYYFQVAVGSGDNMQNARIDADIMLVSDLVRANGVTVNGKQVQKAVANVHDGIASESVRFDSELNVAIGDTHVAYKAVDQYWTTRSGLHECYVLYEVARNPNEVIFEPVETTRSYGSAGLWRSAIIPGWGQMYKKQYVKGGLILALQVGTIAGLVVAENQRSAYISKANATFDPEAIAFYRNKANHFKNIRNGFIIGASAVYVYNLIDAVAARGHMRYKKPGAKKSNLATVAPFVTQNSEYGLSIALNI